MVKCEDCNSTEISYRCEKGSLLCNDCAIQHMRDGHIVRYLSGQGILKIKKTEERLQHQQTKKAQDGVLTSLSKGEELLEVSVPCDSGSKTDSHEVNSVRSEDSPSKSKKHSEFCEGHVDCDKCGSEQCGKVLNVRSDGRVVTVMCLGCMTPRNVKDMTQIEVRY